MAALKFIALTLLGIKILVLLTLIAAEPFKMKFHEASKRHDVAGMQKALCGEQRIEWFLPRDSMCQ